MSKAAQRLETKRHLNRRLFEKGAEFGKSLKRNKEGLSCYKTYLNHHHNQFRLGAKYGFNKTTEGV